MPRSKYSLKQPAMTTYSYNGLYGLNAERLFMWIVIDTTKEQLGIDNIVGAIAIISGQPVISTREALGRYQRDVSRIFGF